MREAVSYDLIVSFADQSEAYVNGFEAGTLWAKMQAGANASDIEDQTITVHPANRVTIERMAAATGWSCQWWDTTPDTLPDFEGWVHLTLTRAAKPTELPNPMGLKIVSANTPPSRRNSAEWEASGK